MSNDEKFIETKKITTDLFRPFGDLLKLKICRHDDKPRYVRKTS